MRHKVYGKHLGRNKNERTALFKNLVQSLILSESIETTEAKAKAIKGLIDKIITQAKSPSTRRLVSQFLVSKKTQDKLIKEILPRLSTRTSGYTSTVRMAKRLGDNALIVKMSLILEEPKKESRVKSLESSEKEEKPKTQIKKEKKP